MPTIGEQLLLLALHDEKGTVLFSASTALPYGLAGATLLDLYFSNRIAIRERQVHVIDDAPTGDEILDEVLQLIESSDKTRDLKHWISRIHDKVKGLKGRLADSLVHKGILEREEHRLLWVFRQSRFPTQDAAPEYETRDSIRYIVLWGQEPGDREVALIGLVKACDLVNEVFAKGERKVAKKRIKELAEGEDVGKAVAAVVAEMTAAIVAIIVASSAATS
jgi:Golgi phosphoprotein 3